MNNNTTLDEPIGVFDSGVGGLSVLRALRQRLPDESFIYVADSGNAPYGDRSADFVDTRAGELAAFLVSHRAKALVLACNTVSVIAARRLRTQFPLPIVAMEPAIKPAALLTKSKKVLVLATTNTLSSESVARLCGMHGVDVNFILQACPGLVEQVERGELQHQNTRVLLKKYIAPGLVAGADTVVLGCTHYAFLTEEIAGIVGPSVTIVEPSEAIARELTRRLGITIYSRRSVNTAEYYTSGSTQQLSEFLALVGEPSAQVFSLPT